MCPFWAPGVNLQGRKMHSKTPIIGGPWHGRRFATYKPIRHGVVFRLPVYEDFPVGAADVLETERMQFVEVKIHQFNMEDADPVFIAAPKEMTTNDVFLALLEPLERQYETFLVGR